MRKCHSNRKDLRRGPRDCWGLLVAHSDWEEHWEGSLGEQGRGELQAGVTPGGSRWRSRKDLYVLVREGGSDGGREP